MDEETKSFLTSKTIWANLVVGLAAVGEAFNLYSILEPQQESIAIALWAGANIVLRLVTNKAIKIKGH